MNGPPCLDSCFAFDMSRPPTRVLDHLTIYGCGVVARLLAHPIQDALVHHFHPLAFLFDPRLGDAGAKRAICWPAGIPACFGL